jgi:DNA polymerase III gamma/tau subunit
MATTERHKVPATILSRCQQFVFRMISPAEILDHLKRIADSEGVQIDAAALGYIVKASEGSMRDAQSLLDQIISFSGQRILDEDVRDVLGFIPNEILDRTIDALAGRDSRSLIENVGLVTDQGLSIQQYVREFTSRIRDLLLARLGLEDKILGSVEEKNSIGARAQRFSEQDLIRTFDMLLRVEGELRQTSQPRFHLEVAFIKMARIGHVRDIEDVIRDFRNGPNSTRAPQATAPVRPAASPAPPDEPPPSPKLPAANVSSESSAFAETFRTHVEQKSPGTAVHLERAARVERTDSGIMIRVSNAAVFSILDNKEHRKVLDEAGRQLFGKPVSVSLIMNEQPAPNERPVPSESGQTVESAREEPLVKRFLEIFRGDLAQVKPAKGE